METEIVFAKNELVPRCYIAIGELKNFRGHPAVPVHIFRTGATDEEMEEMRKLKLVGPPDPAMPGEFINDQSEDAALGCLLEAFTMDEVNALTEYLQTRYANQFKKLVIAPLTLPIPLGVGPLAQIPESDRSGFINFDLAPGYSLPFTVKGYYDLAENN